MYPKSEDPRVKKTRRSLREALIRLILRKGYDAISIQDIAAEAETARITFYRHYKDKEELLADCLNALYDELMGKIYSEMEQDMAGGPSHPSLHVRAFYEHLEEQEHLYRVLFSGLGHQTVVDNLQHFMAQRLMEAMHHFPVSSRPTIPDEIIAYHLVGAHVALGIWWLENDKPYTIDYLTDISAWLSFAGAWRALGIQTTDLPLPSLPEAAGATPRDFTKSKALGQNFDPIPKPRYQQATL